VNSVKRILGLILVALVAAALFAGLVHGVLVIARVSEPATITVYGPTPRRLWATAVAALALLGVVVGGLGLRRAAGRIGTREAIVALVAGLIAVANGALNLATASGGPGTGNGVVGAAAALVLGITGMALGGLALARAASHGPKLE
jgi:hypothetical protein